MNQSLNTLLLVVLLGKRLGNNNSAVKKLGSGLKQEQELIKRRNVKKWKNIFELWNKRLITRYFKTRSRVANTQDNYFMIIVIMIKAGGYDYIIVLLYFSLSILEPITPSLLS